MLSNPSAATLSHWPWRDEHDLRPRDTALIDALRADPRSMLHAAVTPADIGRIVAWNLRGPRLLLVGGLDVQGTGPSGVFEFALGGTEQAWKPRHPMAESRTHHAATLSVAGIPLVIGGDRDHLSPAVDEFAPRRNSWGSVAALPEGRCWHTATTVGGDVFVCGGATSSDDFSSDVLVLRPGTNAWTSAAPMPNRLSAHACATLADPASPGFVVAGGARWFVSAQSHRYDCASDQWIRLGDLSSPRHALCAETLGDGAVYVCGGGARPAATERLDVRAGTWQVVAPLPATVQEHAVCLFDATTMVSLGGYVDHLPSSRCFAYDARAVRWWEEPRWQLPSPVIRHTVTRF